MKTIVCSLCSALILALGASTPALADHGEHRYYRDHPGHRGFYPPARHFEPQRGHYRGYGWVAPAAVLAVTGIAAGVAASAYYAPRPVYVAPPQAVYVAPPGAYWNFCRSAGQYYPNVPYCPEGWQLVPAP